MRYLNFIGYLCIPLAYLSHYWIGHGETWEPTLTFILAALGVVPLAHLMGEATEELSERTGPTWGGLLNATFGNAAELIIALLALYKGLNAMVMASLTGSILGNLLLVAGAAVLVGGWGREQQEFSKASAETNGGMLVVAISAMLAPAIFHFTFQYKTGEAQREHAISISTSIILLLVYAAGLFFTLKTHSHLFSTEPSGPDEASRGMTTVHEQHWSTQRCVLYLLLASVGIGVVAELLVGSAEKMAHSLNWNPIFVGVILLAIIGNAAEHSTAILLARKNDMDTAMTITYQSSLQIALFATPFLVLVSAGMVAMGMGQSRHLDLIFSPMEVAAVILSVTIVIVLNSNGKSNWFEGVMLLAIYTILGIVFFYIPEDALAY